MRKIACVISAVLLLFGAAAGLSSCAGGENLTVYTIAATYDDASSTLSAALQTDVALPFATDTLKFQLWANAYREDAVQRPVSDLFAPSAYYAGKSYGHITVHAVEGAAEFEVGGEDENILTVKLPKPLAAGERVALTVEYEVLLPKINHRLGITETGVNLSGFYPVLCAAEDGAFRECVYSACGDPFVSEIADYEVTLTVPQKYELITGFPSEESASDGKRTYHVRAEGVRDVAFVLGESYSCVRGEAGGVPVSYYYVSDKNAERTLEAACRSLAFFAENFGKYDYPAYTVVETGFVYGGMEFPALSMISTGLSEQESPAVVAHETAHQWWYSMVGSDQYCRAWQDEGLAEFSSALFLDAYPEYGTTYRDFVAASERSFRAYFSVTSQLDGAADTTMNRALPAYSGDYEYRNIAYDKGVILFDRVHETAGHKKCMQALRRYKEKFCGKIATDGDLIACFDAVGANTRALFGSFIDGKCVI